MRWVPTLEDEASVTRLRWAIWAVLAVGVLAFIARGANRPADPVLADPSTARVPVAGFAEIGIAFVDLAGAIVEHCVLLADAPEQQQRGLAGVSELVGYAGMLFRYPQPVQPPFRARDTPMQLSVAFFDQGGTLLGAVDVPPCPAGTPDCPAVGSSVPFTFALQVRQGELAPLGVTLGSRLEVRGPCPPP